MARLAALFLVLAAHAPAADIGPWVGANKATVTAEFERLLSIPNLAADPAGLRRNAEALRAMLESRGIRSELLETAGAPPAVYGELRVPGAARTLLFYAHYDGQPVDRSEWKTDPFRPVHKDGRIWARSASDDKAAIVAMLAAVDALKASKTPLTSNVKFFFEGEEEAGSPHLAQVLRENKDKLQAGLWLVCDGPVHQSGRQQLLYGARGTVGFELTVYGPSRELHSGHYGGWAPNPAMMLAHLLTSMRSEDGRVLVKGFYDRVQPLSEAEKKALAAIPSVDEALQKELALGRRENAGKKIEEIVNEPSLNVRGMRSADVSAQGRNVIPAHATASLDVRLVKGLSPDHIYELLKEHVRSQGYFVTAQEPTPAERAAHPKVARLLYRHGYAAAKTPMDLPLAREAAAALRRLHPQLVEAPTLGGSLPLFVIEQELGAPFVVLPIANHDNNQHAANENIRLDHLWKGIETIAAVMTMTPQPAAGR